MSYRIMNYNIHGWRDSDHVENINNIINCIQNTNPDILVLEEVLDPFVTPKDEKYWNIVKSGNGKGFDPYLSNDKNSNDYIISDNHISLGETSHLVRLSHECKLPYVIFSKAMSDSYFGKCNYGNAILSKYPIEEKQIILYETNFHDNANHSNRRIEAENRVCTHALVHIDEKNSISLLVTHLDQLDESLRLKQMRYFMNEVYSKDSVENKYHILVGDLNTFQKNDMSSIEWNRLCSEWQRRSWEKPPEKSMSIDYLFEMGFRDCFIVAKETNSKLPLTPGPTCWTKNPLMKIDYILSNYPSEAIYICDYNRIIDYSSDHFPIYIDFSFL